MDSFDLNTLDYCIIDEFAQAINWNKVISKSSLISELKSSVQKNSMECCKEKLFYLDESFVSHGTKRWKLFKRTRSSLSDRESKDESFSKRVLRLIKMFTRYCENRKRIIYSEASYILG